MPSPDFSAMTGPMAEAFKRFKARYPSIPLQGIRANPAFEEKKINGQYVGQGIVEINPGITNPDQLDVLLLHEMGHAKGGSEAAATFAESNRPMASHGTPRSYVPAGTPLGLDPITMELLKRSLAGQPKR